MREKKEMKHFLRPYRNVGILVLLGTGAGVVMAPGGAAAQSTQMVELLQGTSPLLLQHSGSQGYLGVWVDDVDADKAQTLKLKEVRGAVVTLIDHDAPAGQIGLRVNDVVLQLNGQNVEGAEQLRRMLKEIPAGRKVSLEFSRDGNLQTTSVELVDRRVMEHDVWNKLGKDSDVFAPATGMGVLAGGGDASLPGMFHMPIWGSTLNVGAMVEPLTSQMAEYLGVPSGLMVKQVAHKTEAAASGLKAFDVILKVGPDAVNTMSDWDRALRANQGKAVQVTILRDRKQQTLTLQVDSKHKTGELEMEELFPAGDCSMLAELEAEPVQLFAQDGQAAASAPREQAQTVQDQMKQFQVTPEQAEKLRQEAEKLRGQFNMNNFKIDPKQMDDLKQQMDQFQQNFKAEDFQFDAQQAEQLRKQALDLRDQLKIDDLKIDPKQMDDLKQQMDQFQQNFKLQDPENAPM
jgi:membrane-associated protease RseP (regulator of RpoE activity)